MRARTRILSGFPEPRSWARFGHSPQLPDTRGGPFPHPLTRFELRAPTPRYPRGPLPPSARRRGNPRSCGPRFGDRFLFESQNVLLDGSICSERTQFCYLITRGGFFARANAHFEWISGIQILGTFLALANFQISAVAPSPIRSPVSSRERQLPDIRGGPFPHPLTCFESRAPTVPDTRGGPFPHPRPAADIHVPADPRSAISFCSNPKTFC